MSIHHAVLKSAKTHGFKLVETEDGLIEVYCGKKLITANANASIALKGAIVMQAEAAGKPKAGKSKDGDGDAPPKRRLAKTIEPYREQYKENDDSCGDELSQLLKEAVTGKNDKGKPCIDLTELKKIAVQNGIEVDRFTHLNPGHQRMCVGNVLRGMLTKGKNVKIGRHTIEVSEAD